MNIQKNISLKKYNTFGIDIRAKQFCEAVSQDELASVFRDCRNERILVLGGGSNILFTRDFDGLVVHPVMKGISVAKETDDYVTVRAAAGEVWDDFVEYCVSRNWGGVENLSGIPGTVGATPVQNVGAYGQEAGNVIERVEALDTRSLKAISFGRVECCFGHRSSIFKRSSSAGKLLAQQEGGFAAGMSFGQESAVAQEYCCATGKPSAGISLCDRKAASPQEGASHRNVASRQEEKNPTADNRQPSTVHCPPSPNLYTLTTIPEPRITNHEPLSNVPSSLSPVNCQLSTVHRPDYVITNVYFRLKKNPDRFILSYQGVASRLEGREVNLRNIRDAIVAIRKEKLPSPEELGNAGSFFLNNEYTPEEFERMCRVFPELLQAPAIKAGGKIKVPSAWLIDRCGLRGKGRKEGRPAGVHENHALVLVNYGGASGNDILSLMKEVQDTIYSRFGVMLIPEVNIIG